MSTHSHQTMTNHHEAGALATIGETLHAWRERFQQRNELARWTERDLHDVGLSWSDVAIEADKPFWRA
ncbi:MAG: DUF1127 domain-containing protein [Proteobacteria bacterium]|nr:DUF1127 domain-containing protein [Pseudomonadota bacterium]